MLSINEWDPIKTIIVSRANDSTVPFIDPSLRLVQYSHIKNLKDIKKGPYPQQVIDEANEDLEKLVDFLHTQNCSVLRSDPVWKPKFTNFCPRDHVFVYDNLALVAPMPVQCRREDYLSIMGLVSSEKELTIPETKNGLYDIYNANVLTDTNTLALFNKFPLFDASNILKANDDLYYLISNSSNMEGAYYLQNLLPDKRVHIINNIKPNLHIHNSIIFVREGLMICNPSHIPTKEHLTSTLHSWDVIWALPPVDIPCAEGYIPHSNWFNMDILVVNPNLVILEEHQTNLADELKKYNVESVMLPMRHAKTLNGGFRSVTLDLYRDHD
jgi:N-dimethylarginine dimethylaminohydrolase